MSYYFPHNTSGSHIDRLISSVDSKRSVYNFRTIKSSINSTRSETPEIIARYMSPQTVPESPEEHHGIQISNMISPRSLSDSLEQLQSLQINHRTSPKSVTESLEQMQKNHMTSPRNLLDTVGQLESQQVNQKTLGVQIVDERVGEQLQKSWQSSQTKEKDPGPEKKLICPRMHQKRRRFMYGISSLQQLNEECESEAEFEASEQKPERLKFAIDNLQKTSHCVTFQNLLDQCQDHFTFINTCTVLQQMVTDEIAKQGKLEEAIFQKLSVKVQRMQQQKVFVENVQAPEWVSADLDELATKLTRRAQAYKTAADKLVEQCTDIQRSLDGQQEITKSVSGGKDYTHQASMPEKKSKTNASTVPSPTSQNPDTAKGSKPQEMTFQQIADTFEDIRKSWLKLLSIFEYQQEQYDTTIARISQVDTEIETLSKTEDSENVLWRIQLQIKDLKTRKELLDARRDHLKSEVNTAKKDLSDFELKNKDALVDILKTTRQHKVRYDANLKQNFELLKSVCLGDPVCLKRHYEMRYSDKSDNQQGVERLCETSPSRYSPSSPTEEDAAYSKQINNLRQENAHKMNFKTEPLREANFPRNEFSYSKKLTFDSRNFSEYKTSGRNNTYVYKFMNDKYINRFRALGTESFKSMPDFNSHANTESCILKAIEIFTKEDANEAASSVFSKSGNNAEWSSIKQTEQPLQKQAICKSHLQDMMETAGNAKEDQENDSIYHPRNVDCDVREDALDVARSGDLQRPLHGNLLTEENREIKCFFTGQSMGDILSDKERRIAYFISKYAGGKHSTRAYLVKNLNGPRPLSWCSISNEYSFCEDVSGQTMSGHERHCELSTHAEGDCELATNAEGHCELATPAEGEKSSNSEEVLAHDKSK